MKGNKLFKSVKNNKIIRILIYPIKNLTEFYLMHKYSHSGDSHFLKEIHNCHDGKRCFVIGNGPSLLPEDLEKLKTFNEICFASNRIYHIYALTSWRPTYYLSLDAVNLMTEINRIKSGGNYLKFLSIYAKKFGRAESDNIYYLCTKAGFKINPSKMSDTLSSDVSKYVARVGTVTVTAIELAIYMGFKTIYLLGVDNNYAKKLLADGTVYVDPAVKTSYFSGMKDDEGKFGDGNIALQNIEAFDKSYEIAKKFACEQGVQIYNATRGGKLETFERVDFDSLFKE